MPTSNLDVPNDLKNIPNDLKNVLDDLEANQKRPKRHSIRWRIQHSSKKWGVSATRSIRVRADH